MSDILTSLNYILLCIGIIFTAIFMWIKVEDINSDINHTYSIGWGGFVAVMIGFFCGALGFILFVSEMSILIPTYISIHWTTAWLIAAVTWGLVYKLVTFIPNKRLNAARASRRAERDHLEEVAAELNSRVQNPLLEKYLVGTGYLSSSLVIFKHKKESVNDIAWEVTQVNFENSQ